MPHRLKILADASLPILEEAFPEPFILTYYSSNDQLYTLIHEADILLCRSTLTVNSQLLHNTNIHTVLTASSGTDHIDADYLQEKHINLLDANGCNAQAVSDYVLCTIAHLIKKQNLQPQNVGIIGFGAVGQYLYQSLPRLNVPIYVYDPYRPTPRACAWADIIKTDIICIHANLHNQAPHTTYNLFNNSVLEKRRKDQIIINAARGGIIEEHALINSHKGIYCTDVYQDEPNINPLVVKHAYQCTPHIAGHSQEAKIRALHILSQKLHAQLKLLPPKLTHINRSKSLITWPYSYLQHYDPQLETISLKNSATDKLATTFLNLRLQHKRKEL